DGDASIASRQPDVRRWPISARSGASSSPRSTVFPEFVMHDWRADVRARLASAQLHPQDEAEIVEEIAQHLEAQFAELAPTIGAPAARERLLVQLRDDAFDEAVARRRRSRPRP